MQKNIALDRFDSRRSTVYAKNGVVATSHPLAAEAGIAILREGGNAFDAAVATAATLNVVEPPSTGIGGDVLALYRTADGEIGGLNSCGGAPSKATPENVQSSLNAQDRATDEITMPKTGAHAVTVPGAARGWEVTVEELGKLSLTEVLQPAIKYATEGYPVSEIIAELWKIGEERFEDPHARETYLINDRAPRVGETIQLPALGETLQTIAEHGADPFYEGEIAKKIAAEVQSNGGFLTVDDLTQFESEFVDPISTSYGNSNVYELPPSTQGAIVLEALNIAEELSAGNYPINSSEHIHYLVESMKIAFQDGHHHITDPKYHEIPSLWEETYIQKRTKEIGSEALMDIEPGFLTPDFSDTVLLTVADNNGNVVSYINSLFGAFGSGLVPQDTGIVLHSRGGAFSLDPDHPNCIEPGKRPFHTLIPAIVNFEENDWAAFGVMGAYMQPQGHLQVISHLIDYDMPLQRALDEPRWRYLESGELAMESRFDDRLISEIVRKGHDVLIQPPGPYNNGPLAGFGGGQIARKNKDTLSAATDPRKDGAAIGF